VILTDTHCHLDFNKFDEDREAVIQRAMAQGVRHILVPALNLASSRAVIDLVRSHPILFAAIGFHPTDVDKWHADSPAELRACLSEEENRNGSGSARIVAIGEVGLDYYWVKDAGQRKRQREVLQEQLALAQETSKPAVIHMREEGDAWTGVASEDLIDILTDWQRGLKASMHPLAERPGVLHSFNGSEETARKALEMNFLIGITGPVTYKNADEKRRIIGTLPLESLLIETDAPFLTPVPHRGGRNEPAYVRHIADKIAEIHSKNPAEIAAATTANARRLFAWGD
jgi:TatD DNase family protein